MKKTYKIFGNITEINLLSENLIQKKTLLKHFSLYDEIKESNNPDIIINIRKENIQRKIRSVNPKTHLEFKNGFISLYPKISVGLESGIPLKADVSLEIQKKGILRYLKKLYNIQYNSIDERISQILHELVLLPLAYFNPKQFLVHSSAFKKEGQGAVLIGGTGGVGKTSLEIELCMNRNYSFIADDISVLDENGNVYPNLSFPKIYAYNLENNSELRKRIFKNRGFFDKLAWKLKYVLNGPAGVRRNISPEEAYGKYETEKTKTDRYYILLKTDTDKINIRKIDAKKASELTMYVIQAEYVHFNNQILWHEFNCKAGEKNPILSYKNVLSGWEELSEKVFENIACYIIEIPLQIEHKIFVKEVADLID